MNVRAASDRCKMDSDPRLEHPSALESIASSLFDVLAPLHQLSEADRALLALALELHWCSQDREAAKVGQREVLVRATLATVAERDACVVEAVVDLSRHVLGYDAGVAWSRVGPQDRGRALWLTGVLRLADALAAGFGLAVEGVYAAWTDALLHIEVDGPFVWDAGLRAASISSAALEVASGRRLVLTSSHQRHRGFA